MLTEQTLVPFDFGEFSPRSLGVTLNLPEGLGRCLYSMASFLMSDDPDEKRYQFLQDFLEQEQDGGAQFIGVSYGSAFIHELKHYHDYLASPFGCSVMMDHFLLLPHLFSVLQDLSTEPVIIIPLQSWRDLSDTLYEVLRKRSQGGQFSRYPPERSVRTIGYAEDTLRRIQSWHSAPFMPNFPLATRQLIEAAAVETQKAQIAALFGPKRLAAFCDYLNRIDENRIYTGVSDLWQKVSENLGGASIPASVRNALLFCALCGRAGSRPDDQEAHPVARFILLLGYIRKYGKIPTEDTILDFLDEWADYYGLPTLNEAMAASAKKNEAYAQAMREIYRDRSEKDGWDFPEMLFDTYDSWIAAHDHMVSEILQNPMTYFDPSQYIGSGDRWVAAPIYISTTSTDLFGLDSPLFKRLKLRGWESVWGVELSEDEGAIALMYHPDLSLGIPVINREKALHLSTFIWLAFALWSRGMLNPANRWVAARMLEVGPPQRKVLHL
jgi:hypothetical protein